MISPSVYKIRNWYENPPQDKDWFVFGSNMDGRHGAGSARIAIDLFGAKYGQAVGPQGHSYAIVTKDLNASIHPSVSAQEIRFQVEIFYRYAWRIFEKINDIKFYVAYKGKGFNLNYFSPAEMAMIFRTNDIPPSVVFEEEFAKLMTED
jgi:hypothetical protein